MTIRILLAAAAAAATVTLAACGADATPQSGNVSGHSAPAIAAEPARTVDPPNSTTNAVAQEKPNDEIPPASERKEEDGRKAENEKHSH